MNRLALVASIAAVLAGSPRELHAGQPRPVKFATPRPHPEPGKPTVGPEKPAESAVPNWSVTRLAIVPRASVPRQRPYRIAFVAEGYRKDERALFHAHARKMVEQLERDTSGQHLTAYRTFEVFFIHRASPEAASLTRRARTLFGAFKDDDCVALAAKQDVGPKLQSVLARTIAVAVDVVVVTVNFGEATDPLRVVQLPRANADYPREGGQVRIAGPNYRPFVHELGHALFGLGDEYSSDHPTKYYDQARFERFHGHCYNITSEQDESEPVVEKRKCTSSRWRWWTASPLPGGATYGKGVWHPFTHCRMNESTSQDFCKACLQSIALTSLADAYPRTTLVPWMPLIDPAAPASAIGDRVHLGGSSIVHVRPGQPFTLRWLNGGALPGTITITLETGMGVAARAELDDRGTGSGVCTASHVEFAQGLPELRDEVHGGVREKRYYLIVIATDGGERYACGRIRVSDE